MAEASLTRCHLRTTVWLRPISLLVIQEKIASPTRHTSMPYPSFLKEGLSHVPCHLKAPTPQKKKNQVVKVSPGGSHLGASWSEGSETNVILGFRVPTTIGLRKPPAGSPCSQSIPGSLEPLGGARGYGQGGSKLKLACLPPSTLPLLQLTLSSLQPHSSLPALSSLLLSLQLAPSSLKLPSSLQLAPSSLQPPTLLPLFQLTPCLLPAFSSLPVCSQLTPACSPCSSLLPALSSLPACSSLLPARSSSLPLLQLALSSIQPPSSLQLSPAYQVASAHSSLLPLLQLALSSLQPPSSLQLAPAHSLAPPHSSLLPALSSLPARSPCSSSLPALSSLPACSPCSSLPAHSQLAPLAPSSLQLAPSSLPSLQLTLLAPACSQLAPLASACSPCSSSLPAHSQWPCMCWGPHHLWGVRGYGAR